MNDESKQAVLSLLNEYERRLLKSSAPMNIDWALYRLLSRFMDELPNLDGHFHKCFRQCGTVDVEAGGHMDMEIHALLSESELFWTLFEKHRIDKEPSDIA